MHVNRGRRSMHTVPLDTVSLQRRRRHFRPFLWKLLAKSKELKVYLPGVVITILFGLAECFTIPSAFPICLLLAQLYHIGKPMKGSIIGMVILTLLRLAWGINAGWSMAGVYILLAVMIRKRLESKKQVYFLLLAALSIIMLPGMGRAQPAEEIFRRMAAVLMGLCAMPAFLRSAEVAKKAGHRETEDDLICLFIPLMVLLIGAARIGVFSVNMGLAAAGLFVVSAGWMGGAMLGAAMGIGMGFAMMSAGHHVLFVMYLPMSGILCGCFRDKNRLWTGLIYGLSAMALVYLTMWTLPDVFVINHIAAMLLFLMIPRGVMKKYRKKLMQMQWMKPRDNLYLRHRMQQWTGHINRLAQVLPVVEIPQDSLDDECELFAERLCDQCERLPICWHERYEETKKGVHAALACKDVEYAVINQYFAECERMSRIPALLDKIFSRRKEIQDQNNTSAYERTMMATHLLALSQAAQCINLEGMQANEDEPEWERRIEEGLEKMHFSGRLAFVKKVDGHMSVGLNSDIISIQEHLAHRLARQVSVYLGVRMQIDQLSSNRMILEEAPVFDLLSGQATSSAMVQEKGSITANGDAVMVRSIGGGRMLFALSDGMGHGLSARNESNRTLEMLSVCLQAGYDRDQTMKVVNGAMLSATGGESFATLDMGIVDLWTGETEMNKLGACSSYVIQGNKIHRLTGEALPLGILQHVLPAQTTVLLEENDRVLLMSDGVADLFETDEDVMKLIQKYRDTTPQEMSENILQEALDRQHYAPQDDMTVLCVQLVMRYPLEQYRQNISA